MGQIEVVKFFNYCLAILKTNLEHPNGAPTVNGTWPKKHTNQLMVDRQTSMGSMAEVILF